MYIFFYTYKITRKCQRCSKSEKSASSFVYLASKFHLMLLYRTKIPPLEWFVELCHCTGFQGSDYFTSSTVQRGFSHSMAVREEECFQDLVSFNSATTSRKKQNFISILCEAQMRASNYCSDRPKFIYFYTSLTLLCKPYISTLA